jgi:hypothetical protein
VHHPWTKGESSTQPQGSERTSSVLVVSLKLLTMLDNDENPLSSDDISLELSCLIEGDRSVLFVNVPGKSKVAALKKLVHEEGKNGILSNVDAKDLVLLKTSSPKTEVNLVAHSSTLWQVDVDLNANEDSLPQLTITGDDESVQLRDWKPISYYWLKQPANDRLHIFVKAPAAGELGLLL